MQPDDHYTIISADSHAGGSHAQYREYLDPEYLDDFDAWRNKYKNPYKDLRRRPPHPQLGQRAAQPPAGGRRRRRRGHLPQHRAAVLPELRALRRAADARGVRAPPRRRPGPQPLARRLLRRVARAPRRHRPDLPQRRRRRHRRRAVDQGARPARRRAAAGNPPDVDWVKPLYDPSYDPLWAVCEDLDVVVNTHWRHRRPGLRDGTRSMPLVHINEMIFYSQRPFVHMIARRRVRALPEAEVRAHRGRVRVGPAAARRSSTG